MSTTTPLPAICALVHTLPGIIQRAVRASDLTVPGQSAPLPPNALVGWFTTQRSGHQDPVWPRFPAVSGYLSGSAAEPLKLRLPVSIYVPITNVEGLMDKGFPTVPPLEPSLSTVFGIRGHGTSDDVLSLHLPATN